jgi:hypothetical protein
MSVMKAPRTHHGEHDGPAIALGLSPLNPVLRAHNPSTTVALSRTGSTERRGFWISTRVWSVRFGALKMASNCAGRQVVEVAVPAAGVVPSTRSAQILWNLPRRLRRRHAQRIRVHHAVEPSPKPADVSMGSDHPFLQRLRRANVHSRKREHAEVAKALAGALVVLASLPRSLVGGTPVARGVRGTARATHPAVGSAVAAIAAIAAFPPLAIPPKLLASRVSVLVALPPEPPAPPFAPKPPSPPAPPVAVEELLWAAMAVLVTVALPALPPLPPLPRWPPTAASDPPAPPAPPLAKFWPVGATPIWPVALPPSPPVPCVPSVPAMPVPGMPPVPAAPPAPEAPPPSPSGHDGTGLSARPRRETPTPPTSSSAVCQDWLLAPSDPLPPPRLLLVGPPVPPVPPWPLPGARPLPPFPP